MQKCSQCDGMGSIVLFSSAKPCGTCHGTGRAPPTEHSPVEVEKSTAHETKGSMTPALLTTTTNTGGTFTITSGTSTGTASGGHITIRGGEDWAHESTRIQLHDSKSGATPHILVGASEPPMAPIGSLYIRDDGASGSLWLKTSADEWSEISTGTPEPVNVVFNNSTFNGDAAQIAQQVEGAFKGAGKDDTSWHRKIIEWTRRRLTENQDAKDDQGVPGWQCSYNVPVIAPVFPCVLADMMSLVEQEGLEIDLFVTSCRDFADVRKWDDTEKVRWEGRRVWVFGIEVVRSKDIPVGHFCAVSRSEKMSVAMIIR